MNSTEKTPVSSVPAKAIEAPAVIKTTMAPSAPAPAAAVAAPRKAVRKLVVKPIVKVAPKAAPLVTTPKTIVKAVTKTAAKAPAKAVKPVAVKPAPKAVQKAVAKPKLDKLVKAKKPKLVRDSFTIPKAEFTVLDDLKMRSGKLGSATKKSELIRAGIKALASMNDAAFLVALKAVPAIKTGRPAKE